MAGFEKLLTDLMVFKSNAATLSQTDRLAYTQGFADAFDEIIGEGADSSDDELPASIVKPAWTTHPSTIYSYMNVFPLYVTVL